MGSRQKKTILSIDHPNRRQWALFYAYVASIDQRRNDGGRVIVSHQKAAKKIKFSLKLLRFKKGGTESERKIFDSLKNIL